MILYITFSLETSIYLGTIYIVPCYVVSPFVTVEMLKHPWPLNKLIGTEQKVYYLYREL